VWRLQEIEVHALVGLQHRLQEQLAVAALGRRLGDRVVERTLRQHLVGHPQRDLAVLQAQTDAVAVLHPCQRPASRFSNTTALPSCAICTACAPVSSAMRMRSVGD
jgi:hypothetical protein